MNDFDPPGYITLEKALERFGQLMRAVEGEVEKASSKGPGLRCSSGLLTARRVVLATWL